MTYPANLELDAPLEVANWRPLVHWLLAFPHLLVAGVLSYVASALAFVSWFIILFTGSIPAGIANFQCMMIRYQARAYSYAVWLREAYPPFTFDMVGPDPGGDPLRVDIAPQFEDRNRLTVGLRIFLLIPIAIFVWLVMVVAYFAAIIAFFAVLFTGRWPEGLRTFVLGAGRLSIRFSAYAYLLVDDYPPFALD